MRTDIVQNKQYYHLAHPALNHAQYLNVCKNMDTKDFFLSDFPEPFDTLKNAVTADEYIR